MSWACMTNRRRRDARLDHAASGWEKSDKNRLLSANKPSTIRRTSPSDDGSEDNGDATATADADAPAPAEDNEDDDDEEEEEEDSDPSVPSILA